MCQKETHHIQNWELLEIDEYARRLNVSLSTVHDWKSKGVLKDGEQYIKIAGIVRYIWELESFKKIKKNCSQVNPKLVPRKEDSGNNAPVNSEEIITSRKSTTKKRGTIVNMNL